MKNKKPNIHVADDNQYWVLTNFDEFITTFNKLHMYNYNKPYTSALIFQIKSWMYW